MSTIRIESKPFAGMLTRPVAHRHPLRRQVRRGYCFEQADGSMEPMLWPIADCDVVLNFLSKIGKGKKDHAVVISRTGDEITVAEDPDLFGDGTSVRFTVAPLTGVSAMVWRYLDPVDGQILTGLEDEAPGVRSDVPASAIAPFQRIASRRGENLQIYRYHRRRSLLVQIGHTYRGLISVYRWDAADGDGGSGPDVDLYVPDLPVEDDERPDRLLAEAASLVITLQQARPELLQKRLRVGEARARLILAQLEERGVVGGLVGSSMVRDVIPSLGSRAAVLDKIAAELSDEDEEPDDFVAEAPPMPVKDDAPDEDDVDQGDLLADDAESDEDGDAR